MLKLNFARLFLSKAVLKITTLTSCQALVEREVVNQEAETNKVVSKLLVVLKDVVVKADAEAGLLVDVAAKSYLGS